MNDMTTRRFDGCAPAVRDAQAFLHRNADSLSGILLLAGGEYARDVFRETQRILDEEFAPDAGQLGRLFKAMKVILMEAAHMPSDQIAALRWHGARMSDLAGRFPS